MGLRVYALRRGKAGRKAFLSVLPSTESVRQLGCSIICTQPLMFHKLVFEILSDKDLVRVCYMWERIPV